jgi:hypothetical protein
MPQPTFCHFGELMSRNWDDRSRRRSNHDGRRRDMLERGARGRHQTQQEEQYHPASIADVVFFATNAKMMK